MEPSQFPPFRPMRGFGNRHAQTICSLYYPYEVPEYDATQHHIDVEPTDRVVLHDDAPADWNEQDRAVLILHGLTGCHRSGHIARIADRMVARGLRTIRMDQRGWGAGSTIAVGHTHAGRSEDLLAAVEWFRATHPTTPLTLVGFSMGGNILLKLMAELGQRAPTLFDSAVVVAPPIDLARCSHNIRRGFNRIYDRSFVRRLHRQVEYRRSEVDGYRDRSIEQLPRNIYDFDNQYTAPLVGFRDAEDYYRQCSTHQILDRVHVQTLLLAAKDDPLIPFEMIHEAVDSSSIELCATDFGGHIGYLGVRGVDADRWWMDWRIVDWICHLGSLRPDRVPGTIDRL